MSYVKFATFLVAFVFGWNALALTAVAQDAPVLLTIEIDADAPTPTRLELTRQDLVDLPVMEFATQTNWTSGTPKFTGVALLDLLSSLNVESGTLELVAINDYSVRVDVEDPTNAGAMIAYLMDDEVMTPRDKGPLWLVYNFDAHKDYRTETIFSRSIWQLDRINISR